MTRTHAWVLVACLPWGWAYADEAPTPFHELSGLSGDAHPELQALLADARDLAADGLPLEPKRVRRVRFGGSANYDEATREREALAQALDLLAELELEASGADDFERASGLRAARQTLTDWINAGLASRDDAQTRGPRLASPQARDSDDAKRLADLPRHASVAYGLIPAAVALTQTLAQDLRAHGASAPPLGGLERAAQVRALREELREARRDALAAELVRAAAAADTAKALEAAQGEASAEQIGAARERAAARAQALDASNQARLERANPVMRMQLGQALQEGAAAASAILARSRPEGILARRARGPYLFLVFVDGLDPDVIREAAARQDARGRPLLPWFQRLLGRSAQFERAFGVFPSVTIANTITLSTGAFPEKTGVPSNAVFDRAARTWTRFLGHRTSRSVDDDVPVSFLHEYFPERDRFTPLMPAQRGVSSSVFAFPAVVGHLFRVGWPDGIFLRTVRRAYANGDGRGGAGSFLPPRCVSLYLGWFDHVSHDAKLGSRSPEAFAELLKYDARLAQLEDDRVRLGIEDLTYTVLFSDHGMYTADDGEGNRTIHLGQRLGELGLQVNPGAVKNGNGPERVEDAGEVGAVADVAGNGSIGLYFRHGSSRGSWGQRNLVHDLQRYGLPSGESLDLLHHLSRLEGVCMALAREGDQACRVVGPAGEGVVRWEPGPDGHASSGRFAYRVDAGQDPLELGALADDALRDARTWLELTADLRYPAAPFQLAQAFAANPDLDVTLCARPGFNFSCGDHQLHADHGLLDRCSIRTSLFVSGPDVIPGPIQEPVLTVDLVPTVLDLVGLQPREDVDGRSLTPTFLRARRAGLADALGYRPR